MKVLVYEVVAYYEVEVGADGGIGGSELVCNARHDPVHQRLLKAVGNAFGCFGLRSLLHGSRFGH